MRWLFGILVILLIGAGYLALAHFSGGTFPTPGLALGGDRGEMRRITMSFWEDVQFKDFKKAASYHSPDKQRTVDIPYLIERIFFQKPESMELMNYEIVLADIDSTGNRGRVKSRLKAKLLLDGSIQEREVMLFYHKETKDAPWYMELESSLRTLDAECGKKH